MRTCSVASSREPRCFPLGHPRVSPSPRAKASGLQVEVPRLTLRLLTPNILRTTVYRAPRRTPRNPQAMQLFAVAVLVGYLCTAQAAVLFGAQAVLLDAQDVILVPLAVNPFSRPVSSPTSTSTSRPLGTSSAGTTVRPSNGVPSSSSRWPPPRISTGITPTTSSPTSFTGSVTTGLPSYTGVIPIQGSGTTALPSVLPSPIPPPKLVFAHHIVGNTYNYTIQMWANGSYSVFPTSYRNC